MVQAKFIDSKIKLLDIKFSKFETQKQTFKFSKYGSNHKYNILTFFVSLKPFILV